MKKLTPLCSALGLVVLFAATRVVAAEPQPILPLDQVRIGMEGYGLTVFHGTTIEPFRVEVVSVEHDFRPGQSVIWVRCPEDRMQKSGPVQGMSGSPIYLWTQADAPEGRVPGRGGLLIGAFAFGFGGSKDCYVGVQPIELMRAAADRALEAGPEKAQARTQASMAGDAGQTLAELLSAARAQGAGEQQMWRAGAIARLLPSSKGGASANAAVPGPLQLDGQVRTLMLPLSVGSPRMARLLSPLLESMGLAALPGGPGASAGKPPPGIDLDAVELQPGSVLAVPLAFGDIDLSAAGTVTDVLPDGRVLAFGHAMFGQGPAAIPMASGYVHMVLPQLSISFKLGGSGVIKGALVRDENVGVIGTPRGKFTTAPATVTVDIPNHARETFEYQLVHHRRIGPVLPGLVTVLSVIGRESLPLENTLVLKGAFNFTGGRQIRVNTVAPSASEFEMFMTLIPPVAAMVQNPFEPVQLESVEMHAAVEPKIRSGTIVNARLLQTEVAPGQTLNVAVRVQPYGQPMFTRTIDVPIPQSLADGDYNLLICDAMTYQQALYAARPHRMRTTSLDELTQSIQDVMDISNTSLYTLLELPDQGLAVGRREMPSLPSSRRAILGAPTSTLATPYMEWSRTVTPMDIVVQGQLMFPVSVRHKFGTKQP